MENFKITMKLNINVVDGQASVQTIPESSNPAGINMNVNTDNIVKVADKVLSYLYDGHSAFKGGFSRVRKGGLYGYVDLALQEAVTPQYVRAFDVCEGYARVVKNGKYKFLQMVGSCPDEIQDDDSAFDTAYDMKNGMALVKIDGKYGFFSAQENEVIIPCEYENAKEFSTDRAYTAVRKDGQWGLVGKDGSIILEPTFDSISLWGNSYAASIGDKEYVGWSNGEYKER